jgi:hypothetical protein
VEGFDFGVKGLTNCYPKYSFIYELYFIFISRCVSQMTSPERQVNIQVDSSTLEISYNVMKKTDHFMLLQASVVITEEYNVYGRL